MITLNYIENANKLDLDKNFILSALNLAFIGYLQSGKIKPNRNYIVWPDGIFSLKYGGTKKLPGRVIINNLKFSKKISKIIVLGNCTKKELLYLKNKYKLEVIHHKLKYGKFKNLIFSLPVINKNYLYILTLPTPLQEQVAQYMSKKFNNFKIICIGGGLKMAAGLEEDCPKILYNLGLEFVWRLRNDFNRRLKRLLFTYFMYSLFVISKKSIKLKKIL